MSVVANVALNLDTSGVPQKLRDVQGQAQQTEKAFNGITAAASKLASAFSLLQGAKFVFAKTAEIESQAKSLEVLTGSAQKSKKIISELQQLGAVTPFTSTELIDAAKRLQAFGIEADAVVETTRRLADVSGATGAELQGLVTAFGQVQAKGRLQGEELLQFQERGIGLQKELQRMYGMTGEEFRKALEKGRFSAKAVEEAIKNLTNAGGKYANGAIAQSTTLQGKFSTLQDGVDALAREIGNTLAPSLKIVLDDLTAFVNGFVQGLQYMQAQYRTFLANLRGKTADELQTQVGDINKLIAENQRQLSRVDPASLTGKLIDKKLVELRKLRGSLQKDLDQKLGLVAPQGRSTLLPVLQPGGGAPPALLGETGGKDGKGAKAAEAAAKRLQEELRKSLETGDQLGREISRQVVQLATASELEKKRNEIQYQYEDRARQISELKNAEQKINLTALMGELRRLELQKLQTEELQKQAEEYIKLIPIFAQFDESLGAQAFRGGVLGAGIGGRQFRTDIDLSKQDKSAAQVQEYKKQLEALIATENQVKLGAEAMGAAFGQTFRDLIAGTTSAQEAFAKMLQSIADHFLDMAAQIITQQITMIIYGTITKALGITGGGFRFSGAGPVSGTDAFSGAGMGSAGFSLPSLMGKADGGSVKAATPYLVGERGPELFVPGTSGSVMSNSDLRASMGSAGGSSNAPVLNMSFETTSIGGVEYVSRDQLEAAMAETRRQATRDGAKRGMSMTLDRIQQSPQTRSRIGIR